MSRITSLVIAVLLVAAGCGSASTVDRPPAPTTPGPVVLDVRIINGDVEPRGARLNVKVGQPVTLAVRSDVDEEIHVHSDPEQSFKVKAGKQQRFTFAVRRAGKVAVEVHHLDAVIAEVLARK
jgi:hypothetical protein